MNEINDGSLENKAPRIAKTTEKHSTLATLFSSPFDVYKQSIAVYLSHISEEYIIKFKILLQSKCVCILDTHHLVNELMIKNTRAYIDFMGSSLTVFDCKSSVKAS